MERPLTIVIFSKDRAAQLDLCLKSIHKNLESLSSEWKIEVIYTASSKEFEEGYATLQHYWDNVFLYFRPERLFGGFKEALEENIRSFWGPYVLFFTDDDIVYKNFEFGFQEIQSEFEKDEGLACVSLRLGTNTFVQDQYTNSNCHIPDDVIMGDDNIRKWNWKNQIASSNFAYPFSVDGHIFKSEIATKMIGDTEGYYNPNSLEGKAQHVIKDIINELPEKMGCMESSYVVNTPINRVQETCTNEAGKFFGNSPEELNEIFLNKKRLDLEALDFSTIIGAHQELKLIWG
tara:strand:+ start:8861 stop:9730 length:870 start_codon:yes stop_codon:yes gene_type:complete